MRKSLRERADSGESDISENPPPRASSRRESKPRRNSGSSKVKVPVEIDLEDDDFEEIREVKKSKDRKKQSKAVASAKSSKSSRSASKSSKKRKAVSEDDFEDDDDDDDDDVEIQDLINESDDDTGTNSRKRRRGKSATPSTSRSKSRGPSKIKEVVSKPSRGRPRRSTGRRSNLADQDSDIDMPSDESLQIDEEPRKKQKSSKSRRSRGQSAEEIPAEKSKGRSRSKGRDAPSSTRKKQLEQEDLDRKVAEELARAESRYQPRRSSRAQQSYREVENDDDLLDSDPEEKVNAKKSRSKQKKNKKVAARNSEDELSDELDDDIELEEDEEMEQEEEIDNDEDEMTPGRARRKTKIPRASGEKAYFTPSFPESLELDKILGVRIKDSTQQVLIKFKGYSYLHATWRSRSAVEKLDPKNKARIEKFLASPAGFGMPAPEDEDADDIVYFSSDFTDVHRILAYYEIDVDEGELSPFGFPFDDNSTPVLDEDRKPKRSENGRPLIRYAYVLVKWSSLPYHEITWEPLCAIDEPVRSQKLAQYRNFDSLDYEKAKHMYAPMGEEVRRSPKFVHLDDTTEFEGLNGNGGLHLRDYQVSGVNWMLLNWNVGRAGCLLADEMGLGKTIQIVGLLEALHAGRFLPKNIPFKEQKWMRTRGPHLVVVPLSCIFQWEREFATWTKLNAVIFHGVQESREMIKKYEFFFRNSQAWDGENCNTIYTKEYARFDLLITTYEVAARDAGFLRRLPWRCIVVDEAHRLKNWQSKLAVELGQYERDFTVLLTGTPIQNNTEELWALFHFLTTRHQSHRQFQKAKERKKKRVKNSDGSGEESPEENSDDETERVEGFWFRAENREAFMREFGDITNHQQATKLHKLLRPFLLRRVKEDVGKQLPPKEETIIEVELTSEQKKYYRSIYERNTKFLYRGGKAKNGPSLMNIMMELRKCCNHPFLIRGAEERILEDNLSAAGGNTATSREEVVHRLLVEASGKLVLLDKLLPKLKDGGHRVLIFSQMTRMLDILEDYLRLRGFLYERMDGQITGMIRQAAIDRYSAPGSDRFVMLLSTRAGGLGLNLTAADTVIIFDSDWNPQNDMQAQARSHRIGQTRPVKIYRLLTRKTYEMAMFDAASMKLGLDRAMLSVDDANKGSKPALTAAEVDRVLKHGAYAVFAESEEDSNEKSRQFMEAGIDEILNTASHVVNYSDESKKQENKALSGFSTAVFVNPKEPDANVNVDDPEFWTKVAGFEKPEVDIDLGLGDLDTEQILLSGRKRNRKTVQRMGMVSGNGGDGAQSGGDDDDDYIGGNASDDDALFVESKRKTARELKEERKLERQLERERRKAEKFRARLEKQQQRAASSANNRVRAPSQWSSNARNKLIRGLQRFGWGRWVDIRRHEQLESYGDEMRIMRFACVVVRVLYKYALHDFKNEISGPNMIGLPFDPERTANFLIQQANQVRVGEDEVQAARKFLSKSSFTGQMLSGEAMHFFQRLEMLHHIRAISAEAQLAADASFLEAVSMKGRPILNFTSLKDTEDSFIYQVRIPKGIIAGIGFGAVVDEQADKAIQWVVRSVVAGSAGDQGGFLRSGDVLASVNGFPASLFENVRQLSEAILSPRTVTRKRSSVLIGPSSKPYGYRSLHKAEGGDNAAMRDNDEVMSESDLARDDMDDVDDDELDEFVTLIFVTWSPHSENASKVGLVREMGPVATPDQPKLVLKILDYLTQTPTEPMMTASQIADWIGPATVGRSNVDLVMDFLCSDGCEMDNALAGPVKTRLLEKYINRDEHDANGTPDRSPGLGAILMASREIQVEQSFMAVAARELDALEVLSQPLEFTIDRMMLMDRHPWTREMDMHLLLGFDRYGMGVEELNYIAADPAFIFAHAIGPERAQYMLQSRLAAIQQREDERKARFRDQQRRYRAERKKTEGQGQQDKEEGKSTADGKTDEAANENANDSSKPANSDGAEKPAEEGKSSGANGASENGNNNDSSNALASEVPLPPGPAIFLPNFQILLHHIDQILYRDVRLSLSEAARVQRESQEQNQQEEKQQEQPREMNQTAQPENEEEEAQPEKEQGQAAQE